jgi:Putative metal-binding motif
MRWLLGLSMLLWAGGCKSSVDPDKGRFSCVNVADCAATGWECRPQFDGGGRCFRAGECQEVERCNGLDDNCDGRVDESFPEADAGCVSSRPGACAPGVTQCLAGATTCVSTVMPKDELCNTIDDNCDGQVDEGFDFTSDSNNCGRCNNPCGSGQSCRASVCRETSCADGLDNDRNGLTDCADDSCFGLECKLAAPPNGTCGWLRPDAGASDGGTDGGVRDCFLPETACDNGLDDDHDDLVDCLDPDCNGRTCASGTQCTNRTCPGPG